MPKTKISEYSVTNSSNTDIEGINIDEGCAPSGINNAIRELMVHLKEFQTGASGDAFTFAGGVLISGTANTITGNVLMSGTNTITGSTTATFAAGAVGTPSIAAHGDTNTGVYFPAADEVAVAAGGSVAAAFNSHQFMGMRNRIINGDMRIDQRNAGAAVTVNSGTQTFPVDRWYGQGIDSAGVFTLQRSTTVPTNFVNSVVATVTTVDSSLAATDYYLFSQRVEGFNSADLGWGTANAKSVTLSFWVRSSVTGTFGGSFSNSATNRSYPFTYTINSANTYEYKTITVAGDTSGTWLTDNGIGIFLYWGLGAGTTYSGTAGAWSGSYFISATGATNLMATNGATWYITGVQLEVGSVATPFERRPYGTELALCQRYYFTRGGDTATEVLGPGSAYSTTGVFGVSVPFPVVMRTTPTFSVSSASNFAFTNSTGSGQTATAVNTDAIEVSSKAGIIRGTVASGLTAGNCSVLYAISSSARANWSAEL